jgi:hypothetical protein
MTHNTSHTRKLPRNTLKIYLYFIEVLNSNTEFEQKIENKNMFAKAETLDESGMTPCPGDVNLKNGSHQKEDRALLQNNIKAKPE